ncbi:MAG TPA: hypothetical protein VFN88_08840 [Caulobacteraceae bacterium]|nr:hypothetical protein [Caulobacteraceae bacterium]
MIGLELRRRKQTVMVGIGPVELGAHGVLAAAERLARRADEQPDPRRALAHISGPSMRLGRGAGADYQDQQNGGSSRHRASTKNHGSA